MYGSLDQELEGMGNLVYNLETYSATVMPPGLPSSRTTPRGTTSRWGC